MLAQIIEEMGYAQVHNSILLINVMIRRAVEFEQKASEMEMEISYFRFLFHYVHIKKMQAGSNQSAKIFCSWKCRGRLNLPSKR